MLDERKVKLMTKLALYEETYGKEDFKISSYYRKDYAVSDLHKWEDRLLEFQGEHNDIPFEICEWEKEPKGLINKKFTDFEVSIIE